MSSRAPSTKHRMILAQATFGMLAMHDFAVLLIDHMAKGGALDDHGLAAVRAECLHHLGNAEASNLSIEETAEVVEVAAANVEHLIDDAIRRGRQPREL